MENTLPEIPRLYTAIAQWSACLIYVIMLKKRTSKLKIVGMSVGFLATMSVFLVLTDHVSIYWWIPCMVASYLLMVGYIYACCKVRRKIAFYYGIQAFVISEFSAFLDTLIYHYGSYEGNYYARMAQLISYHLLSMFDLLLVCAITTGIMIFFLKKYLADSEKMDLSQKDFWMAMIIGIVVFAGSNVSFLSPNTILSGTYYLEIVKLHLFIDLAGMIMLYAQFVRCHETYIQRELDAVQNVLQNQYQQYKLSKESINLINYKYHDLKHQIAALKAEENPQKRIAFLEQMENEIKQYELQNKTGNKVLDTVLTSKSMYCDTHGITLTTVADGSLLEFMNTMDICSIFGNALDNAIECEQKIKEPEKRLIHLTVSKQKGFLMIRVENYFEGNLEFQEGKLKTTKKEKKYHGYGIESIKYTVEKYEGAVTIDEKNQWFELKILIPLPTE